MPKERAELGAWSIHWPQPTFRSSSLRKSWRQTLFLYLAHRAVNAPWKAEWQSAASRFLSDDADVVVFGVLVRDVDPHEDDLRVRATSLAAGRPARMAMELVAVYMPAGSIAEFPKACASDEEGKDAD